MREEDLRVREVGVENEGMHSVRVIGASLLQSSNCAREMYQFTQLISEMLSTGAIWRSSSTWSPQYSL